MASPLDTLDRSPMQLSPSNRQNRSQDDKDQITSSKEERAENTEHVAVSPLAPSPQQIWNNPRKNVWRTFATFLGLFIMGLSDAAYGALIPYVRLLHANVGSQLT